MKQDQNRIAEIAALLSSIQESISDLLWTNEAYSNPKVGTVFDYNAVITTLKSAKQTVESAKERIHDSARNPRPANLPKDMPWSERFADPDEDVDPYVYDGSMSPEDYDKMHATIDLAHPERKVEPYDALPAADLQAGNDLKIRFFGPHGVFFLDSEPFSAKVMEIRAAMATLRVDVQPPDEYAGWTMFQWNEQKKQWWPYRDEKGKGLRYDTGRRPGHMITPKKPTHSTPAKQTRRKNTERER